VIFFGSVQGVGFRQKASLRALELSLKGYAQNRSDGSVLIRTEGSAEEIFKLIQHLTDLFSVSKAELIFEPFDEVLDDFSIRRV